ncbi:metal-sensitive transcriptional repressor [Slackia faecicanis]|uniref:Metal-sensitive transcriptional repressor n=2 Tax=Slackia faecicanis TaxID=255723 RepID=A0A3N0ADH5_9ACTN|nr:metal-sensitive transcriptional repressor [Slackia faecicanis]
MPSAACCAGDLAAETKQEDAACHAAGVQNVDAAQGAVDRGDAPAAVGSDVEGLGADAACPASDATATGSCCACRQKQTERTAALQTDVQKRLNRVIGQLNGIKSMVESNRYCGDVLIQLAASEAAVHRVSEIILQDHMETCVVEQIREGNVEVVDEAMKLIKKFM